ncbi:hypothetical protein J6590_000543 [Homalodisca vitripennis]|nr:hypothetical protein J6590_000543 [Homalodisca vitripennis]
MGLHREERPDDGECSPEEVLADPLGGGVLPQPKSRSPRPQDSVRVEVNALIALQSRNQFRAACVSHAAPRDQLARSGVIS